jgi:hypothetical protein
MREATSPVGDVQRGKVPLYVVPSVVQRQGQIFIDGPMFVQQIIRVLQPTSPGFRSAVLRMVEDYTAVFGGRDAQLAALDAFLEGDKSYALLIAPTGRGKTALLIHWAAWVQATGRWAVVFAPISLRYQTAWADVTLGAIAAALADLHGETAQLDAYRQTPGDLRAIVADYLRRPLPDDRRLLLILDGLDEAVGWQIGRDLFPRTPGPHLQIVASTRQLANTTHADWLDQLGWRAAKTVDIVLPELDRTAVSDILHRMDNPLDALATDVDLVTEIARVSQGDPLTIRLLVEALQDGALTPGKLTHLPPGLEAFVRSWLDELQQHSAQHATIRTLLGLCATALGPLTIDNLEALAPDHFQVRAALNQATRSVARFVIGDGSEESGYVFSHPRLRELFLEKVLSGHERANLQQRFIAYGEQWYEQHLYAITCISKPITESISHWASDLGRPLPAYLRQFWITHLALAERWDLANTVLTDIIIVAEYYSQPWAAARYAVEGSYTGYLADLYRVWTHAEERNDLALGVRSALIGASIRSLSDNFSPELLVGLVTVGTPTGKWNAAAALEHVRYIPDARRQAEAICALLNSGCTLSFPQVFDVTSRIADERSRSKVLISLAPYLPARLMEQVLRIAHEIEYDYIRAEVLVSLAPYLPAELMEQALTNARMLADEWMRAKVLINLVPYLPAKFTELGLDSVSAIVDDRIRTNALKNVVRHLPPELIRRALESVRTIRPEWSRVEVLINLAPHLPAEQQAAVYASALESAHAIADERSRTWVLIRAAWYLSAEQQAAVYASALESAHAIADERSRAEALMHLAQHLPAQQQALVYVSELENARAILDQEVRINMLIRLAPHLPADQQALAYVSELESAYAIPDEERRVRALSNLAPYLPTELATSALDNARMLETERSRLSALSRLDAHLATHHSSHGRTHWHTTIRTLAARGRPAFLSDLTALMPWLAALATPEELTDIAIAIRDVTRCWP